MRIKRYYKYAILMFGIGLYVAERGLDVSGVEILPLAIALWSLGGLFILIALILFAWTWLTGLRKQPSTADNGGIHQDASGAGRDILQAGRDITINAPPPVVPAGPSSERTASGNVVPVSKLSDLSPRSLVNMLKGKTTLQAEKLMEPAIGKWIRVDATIANISPLASGVFVTAEGTLLHTLEFRDQQSIDLLALKSRGDRIKVVGRIERVDGGVWLEDCELVVS